MFAMEGLHIVYHADTVIVAYACVREKGKVLCVCV